MLDSTIIELANRMIQPQFHERSKQLAYDIGLAQSKAGLAGAGRSSALIEQIYNLCGHDIELRALIVWQNLFRVLSQTGVVPSEEFGKELKQEVLRYEQEICAEPFDIFEKIVRNSGIKTVLSLTDARDRALAKVTAEIDLFLLSLTRRAEAQKNQSPAIFNFYSPVGAVQTGPSATANVIQTINPSEKETLLKALETVKQGLVDIDALPAHPKNEIIELVDEAHTEVNKSNPNGTKLGSILLGIATAIQTAGSLQPAYHALKAALIPLGIPLP